MHRAAVLVDEALPLEHVGHVDVLGQPVPQPGAHRRPLVGAGTVTVRGAQPGGVRPCRAGNGDLGGTRRCYASERRTAVPTDGAGLAHDMGRSRVET